MHRIPLAGISVLVALYCTSASAQEPAVPQPADSAPRVADGARFRGGIALAGGLESVSDGFGNSVSGLMVGVDGRLGLQLNNLLGFYVQPHLSFGSLSSSSGSLSGFTGTFTSAVMAEVTLADRFFVGAGFGYGVLNNPSGPMFQARVGGYPLMGRGGNGIRRNGLMVGVDLRTVFVTGGTGILVLGSIGYEAF